MYYEHARKTVVEELIDANRFTVGDEYTELSIKDNYLNSLSPYDIQKILKQFELDGKLRIVKEIRLGYDFPEQYELEIPDIKYFEDLVGYKKDEAVFEERNEFELTLSLKDTSLYLNDIFLITNTKFGFENYEIIKYLIENPNRLVTRDELIKNTELESVNKSFTKIVENLKFKGDLRKAFFKVKKTGIILYNPVTKARLDELGLSSINLFGEDKESLKDL